MPLLALLLEGVTMSRDRSRHLKDVLLPCPFCGGKGRLQEKSGAHEWWLVRCERYLCGGTTWAMDDRMVAVAAWNRRSSHDRQE